MVLLSMNTMDKVSGSMDFKRNLLCGCMLVIDENLPEVRYSFVVTSFWKKFNWFECVISVSVRQSVTNWSSKTIFAICLRFKTAITLNLDEIQKELLGIQDSLNEIDRTSPRRLVDLPKVVGNCHLKTMYYCCDMYFLPNNNYQSNFKEKLTQDVSKDLKTKFRQFFSNKDKTDRKHHNSQTISQK